MCHTSGQFQVSADRPFRAAFIVPAFNHGASIAGVLDGLTALRLPIIVVDDGSTDDTSSRLARWASDHKEMVLRAPRHARNSGKAAALKTGFRVAHELGATHAVSVDADWQLDPEDLPRLIATARDDPTALVLGRRAERTASSTPRWRRGRDYANLAVRMECGLRLSDSQCSLRIYPLGLVGSIRCRSERYSFEAEVIARAAWAGCRVLDVPVLSPHHTDLSRTSHFRPWRDSLRQAGVHLALLARAVAPWPHRRWPSQKLRKTPSVRLCWRALLGWMNPARCWRDLRGSQLGRLELATAIGLGAMIGATPFFGLHAAISAFVAWRLHLHPTAVVAGSQVSMPPLGVALAIASIKIGRFMLTGSLAIGPILETHDGLWKLAMCWLPAWMLGSLAVGLVLGVAAFGAVLMLGRAFAIPRDPATFSVLPDSPPHAG